MPIRTSPILAGCLLAALTLSCGCGQEEPAPPVADALHNRAAEANNKPPATAEQSNGKSAIAADKQGDRIKQPPVVPVDPEQMELLTALQVHDYSSVRGIAFSRDGTKLLTGGSPAALWELGREEPLDDLAAAQADLDIGDEIRAVAFSPSGKYLALGCDSGALRIWDVERRSLIDHVKAHPEGISTVAFAPDDRRLASAGFDSAIRIWDISTGDRADFAEGGQTAEKNSISCVAYSPDGQWFAFTGQSAWLCNLKTGKEHKLAGNEARIGGAEFSPDSTLLAVAEFDSPVKLWDVAEQEAKQTLTGHDAAAVSAAFARDGRTLASASHDGTIKLWSVDGGPSLKTFQVEGALPESVAWSSQGYLAAAFDNGVVVIYGARPAWDKLLAAQQLAQNAPPAEPDPRDAPASKKPTATTIEAAIAQIDFRQLPKLADAEIQQDRATQVSYTVQATIAEARELYENALVDLGWKLQPPLEGTVTDQYAQLDFTKDKFNVGVSLYLFPDTKLLSVGVNNYGNLDARTLPKPQDAELLFGNAMTALYATQAAVVDAAADLRQQLAAAEWQEYTQPHAQLTTDPQQQILTLKQNGLGLNVLVGVAPAQDGKTTLQYSLRMLADTLPAPADAAQIEFLEAPLQLACESAGSVADTLAFYRKALVGAQWQEQEGTQAEADAALAVFRKKEGLPIVLKIERTPEELTSVTVAEFELPDDKPDDPPPALPTKTPDGDPPLPETSEVPDIASKLPTYEAWLKKNNFQPSVDRLEQYAKEMEKLAEELAQELEDAAGKKSSVKSPSPPADETDDDPADTKDQ